QGVGSQGDLGFQHRIDLGVALDGETPAPDVPISIPLSMLNRHGLVAGATGTGKTVTLQVLAEQLSRAGVPVFASDIKGDLSGIGAPRRRACRLAWPGSGRPARRAG
ncbi:DUF853 family protein, partial [Mycobacterium tuberculosis]|nr:DUF853 family protein [Mycobacterium tuberculosis]